MILGVCYIFNIKKRFVVFDIKKNRYLKLKKDLECVIKKIRYLKLRKSFRVCCAVGIPIFKKQKWKVTKLTPPIIEKRKQVRSEDEDFWTSEQCFNRGLKEQWRREQKKDKRKKRKRIINWLINQQEIIKLLFNK